MFIASRRGVLMASTASPPEPLEGEVFVSAQTQFAIIGRPAEGISFGGQTQFTIIGRPAEGILFGGQTLFTIVEP